MSSRTAWPRATAAAALLAALGLPIAAPASAQQSLAERVSRAVPDAGTVEFRFAAREGVCGDGRSFISIGRATLVEGNVHIGDAKNAIRAPCTPGPVRVLLARRDGEAQRVKTYVGDTTAAPPPRAEGGVVQLGTVDPVDAARYLLDVAARSNTRGGEEAILPAVLADRAVVWPSLLAIARDSSRSRRHGARSTAALWLARLAAAKAEGRPNSLDVAGEDETEDANTHAKRQAVFALSQLPRREGVPTLLDVARTNRDPRVRSHAMFWLGQSGDPRAFALFEQILSGR